MLYQLSYGQAVRSPGRIRTCDPVITNEGTEHYTTISTTSVREQTTAGSQLPKMNRPPYTTDKDKNSTVPLVGSQGGHLVITLTSWMIPGRGRSSDRMRNSRAHTA